MFGVSPSPFLLNATIDLHLEQYLSTALDFLSKLHKSFYVDDLITGSDDKEKAYHFCVNSKEVMKAGGFHLRKLNSNSVLLRTTIKTMDQICKEQSGGANQEQCESEQTCSGTQKVRGML